MGRLAQLTSQPVSQGQSPHITKRLAPRVRLRGKLRGCKPFCSPVPSFLCPLFSDTNDLSSQVLFVLFYFVCFLPILFSSIMTTKLGDFKHNFWRLILGVRCRGGCTSRFGWVTVCACCSFGKALLGPDWQLTFASLARVGGERSQTGNVLPMCWFWGWVGTGLGGVGGGARGSF